MYDTIGVTPGHAQYKAKVRGFSEMDPTWSAPIPTASRDPCNNPEKTFKKHPEQHELWPSFANEFSLKSTTKTRSNKSNIILGDERFAQSTTIYNDVHANSSKATGQKGIMNAVLFDKTNRNVAVAKRVVTKFSDLSREEIVSRYAASKKSIDLRTLKGFQANMRLRLAAKMTNDNVNGKRMNRMFHQFDGDGSGYIELEEFHKGLLWYGIQLDIEQCTRLFAEFDTDGNGFLSYTEFMKEMLEDEYFKLSFRFAQGETQEERAERQKIHVQVRTHRRLEQIRSIVQAVTTPSQMVEAFQRMDSDGSGYLSSEEFIGALEGLNIHLLPAEKQAVFQAVDVNHDNKISFIEFLEVLGHDAK